MVTGVHNTTQHNTTQHNTTQQLPPLCIQTPPGMFLIASTPSEGSRLELQLQSRLGLISADFKGFRAAVFKPPLVSKTTGDAEERKQSETTFRDKVQSSRTRAAEPEQQNQSTRTRVAEPDQKNQSSRARAAEPEQQNQSGSTRAAEPEQQNQSSPTPHHQVGLDTGPVQPEGSRVEVTSNQTSRGPETQTSAADEQNKL
ncbi:unnamed protein product [Pleuronectes platessa]|uniref:Uncharacterized protein n=1 Tax=Pleuronectes platessa TaxID=8262 RepID=A0A9N7URB7_PLEPL|nr:unnamed protein product [Pleuronectes platessa]